MLRHFRYQSGTNLINGVVPYTCIWSTGWSDFFKSGRQGINSLFKNAELLKGIWMCLMNFVLIYAFIVYLNKIICSGHFKYFLSNWIHVCTNKQKFQRVQINSKYREGKTYRVFNISSMVMCGQFCIKSCNGKLIKNTIHKFTYLYHRI